MIDYQAQLEKLRRDAAECALIADLATSPQKRELFARLAEHLGALAADVERAMTAANENASGTSGDPGPSKPCFANCNGHTLLSGTICI